MASNYEDRDGDEEMHIVEASVGVLSCHCSAPGFTTNKVASHRVRMNVEKAAGGDDWKWG